MTCQNQRWSQDYEQKSWLGWYHCREINLWVEKIWAVVVLYIGAGSGPEMVSMHGQTVEPVVKFTYLGSDVDSEGYSTPEIHRRLGMGNSIMGQLDTIWRQRKLSMQTKLRLYTSLVLSVLLYGSETWTLRRSDSDRLQSFHMMSQRRILGVRWFEHVTNASIQGTTGLMNLPLIIADRRHDLFGHVCRLPQETPVRQALQLCIDIFNGDRPTPEWKRPRGRPRRSWLQQIEEDFGAPIGVAYIAAQDRSNWRSLRPSAGLAHQWVSEWVVLYQWEGIQFWMDWEAIC